MEEKLDLIIGCIQKEYPEVTKEQILSVHRYAKYKVPRFIAIYILHNHDAGTLIKKAELFNRHHSSLIHAEVKVIQEMRIYPQFKSKVDRIEMEFILKNYPSLN